MAVADKLVNLADLKVAYDDNAGKISDLKSAVNYNKASTKNILDLSNVVYGSINSSGGIVSNDAYSTKNFIPVVAGKSYISSVDGVSGITASRLLVVAFYSADNETNYLSRLTNVQSFTVPEGATYARFTSAAINTSNIVVGFYPKAQIEEGAVPSSYVPPFELSHMTVPYSALKSALQYYKGQTKNILDLSEVVYGSVNGSGKIVANDAYSTKNFIPVEAGKSYISSVDGVTGITASRLLIVAFYSSDDETSYISRLTNVQSFTVPTGAKYARFSSAAINTDNVVVGFYPKAQIEEGTTSTPFVPAFELSHMAVPYSALIDKPISISIPSSPSAVRPVGHAQFSYFDTDYAQIICYGQSLSVGADSLYVQDSVIPGCYALGSLTTPSATLNPLQLASNGQHPIVSAVNSLHTLLTSNGLYAPNMVAGSYGAGGQSIAQLMSSTRQSQIKSEEGYSYDITTENKYQVFLNSLTAMKTAVGEHSVCCPVIVFLQGERDYYSDEELSDLQPGATVQAYACGDNKAKYKKYMGWLKNDMQNACVSVLGQSKKPLFVIYQVSGNFVKKHDLGINMAQQEFAEENDDVILLPAPYFTPNYGSAHLATNGYRWLGEYIAEAVFQASIQRSKYQPLIARDIRIEGNKVFISTSGATLPLKLDAYTVEQTSENGFRLWRDGTKYTVLSVSFRGDEIVLATGSSIDLSKAGSVVEVSYAGFEVGGTGNVRDSAQYRAMYNYWNDTNDTGASGSLSVNHRPTDSAGNSMVGKPYPMFNWLSPFYWTQTNPS